MHGIARHVLAGASFFGKGPQSEKSDYIAILAAESAEVALTAVC